MNAYTVYVRPAALKEIKSLPGHIRRRVRKAVDGLARNPRPAKSKALEHGQLPCEPRRLRIELWRVIYAIVEEDKLVDVVGVRKRPPYDYGDLEALLEDYT